TLAAGGVMNEGKWSVLLGFNGISGASEELIVARNIILSRMVDWKIHMQHISVKESVDLIRQARKRGIKVTGEATPHHITLTDEKIKSFDTNYKMNPPLRSEEDRIALIEGIADDSITVIATDHAPHTATAKMVEFNFAPFGIIGLETAFSLCYTELVKKGVISLPKLIEKLTKGPAEVMGIENFNLAEGNPADLVIFDPAAEYVIDKNLFKSKARNTPFDGMSVAGRIERTYVDGKLVYQL
ncbi:MAG: dihydroorotase, partial [Lentisphaeria bacterium]|nr:dihydroorotase [Lentisphaeria bacterium]